MKFAHYTKTDAEGAITEGVCHRAKLETLATPGSAISITMISDEIQAKLVSDWGGVSSRPVVIEKIEKKAAKK